MSWPTSRRVSVLVLALALLAAPVLSSCANRPETISRRDYLALVAEWRERDADIRDRAARAAGEDTNDAFAELRAESEDLRADIAAVPPPQECVELHDAFIASQEHFGTALEMLGEGEDIAAIDELILSNEARALMKSEAERFGAEI